MNCITCGTLLNPNNQSQYEPEKCLTCAKQVDRDMVLAWLLYRGRIITVKVAGVWYLRVALNTKHIEVPQWLVYHFGGAYHRHNKYTYQYTLQRVAELGKLGSYLEPSTPMGTLLKDYYRSTGPDQRSRKVLKWRKQYGKSWKITDHLTPGGRTLLENSKGG